MDSVAKKQAENDIFLKLDKTLALLGCTSPVISVVLKDTDLSPLQPLIGDYIEVSVSGIIRLQDYAEWKASQG